MNFGDVVRIKGLAGVATVNAVFDDGTFTVTDAEGAVHGPYIVGDIDTPDDQAP